MTIGQIIVKLRKDMGLTQGQLAEKLYVSRQAVSKWENGTALPGLDNIRALSEFFGVPTDMFLRPDEASEPREEKSPLQPTLQNHGPFISSLPQKRPLSFSSFRCHRHRRFHRYVVGLLS